METGVPGPRRPALPHLHHSPDGLHHDYRPDHRPGPGGGLQTLAVDHLGRLVDHPDPEERRKHEAAGTGVDYAEGIKLTDPRRMAVYFAKYGSGSAKDYQHRVPAEWLDSYLVCEDCGTDYDQDLDECPDCGCLDAELVDTGGPGRFWGYRGLRPVLAAREVTPEIGIGAGRVLRRWYAAKGLTRQLRRERVDLATGHVTTRNTTLRKRLFRDNRGFVTVNDGPAMASQLARYLTAAPPPETRAQRWRRLRQGRPPSAEQLARRAAFAAVAPPLPRPPTLKGVNRRARGESRSSYPRKGEQSVTARWPGAPHCVKLVRSGLLGLPRAPGRVVGTRPLA